MLPSFVICPMSTTGVPLSLAYFKMAAAHSRTCVMLPGALSMVSLEMVCTESITTKSGCVFLMCVKICSKRVSQTSKQSAEGSMRSARSFICFSLSSPLTYNTRRSLMRSTVCSNNVLLPMPGSPPNKIREPGTNPPPSTRFNSASCMSMRGSSSALISDKAIGRTSRSGKPVNARRARFSAAVGEPCRMVISL